MTDIRKVTLTIEAAESGETIAQCSNDYDLDKGFAPDYRETVSAVFRQLPEQFPGEPDVPHQMSFRDKVHGFRASCTFNYRAGSDSWAKDLHTFVMDSYAEIYSQDDD